MRSNPIWQTYARPLRLAAWLLACAACAPALAANPTFAPPPQTFTADDQMPALRRELAAKDYAGAAARLSGLLLDQGDALLAAEPGGHLMSFATHVATLPTDVRDGLRAAYRAKLDEDARLTLAVLRATPGSQPEDFYAFARRRPFSSAAASALVTAADLALEGGDFPAALAYLQLAARDGWSPDAAHARQLALLTQLDAGQPLPPPSAATRPAGKPPARPFAGPAPFDALWLNNLVAGGDPRLFPLAADDRIYFCTPRAVLAFRDNGELLWSATPAPAGGPPKPPPRRNLPRGGERGATDASPLDRRPPLCAPAALWDAYGRPQILVARQLGAVDASNADDAFALRAYRAADGKPLWSTDADPQLQDLSFAGTPAVCGRYVYAVALAIAPPNRDAATLSLVALETATGKLLWQSTLGTFTAPRERHQRATGPAPWQLIWEQSEPAVAGDVAYVTPGAGIAAAVGRFDGKLRWARSYASTEDETSPSAKGGEEGRRALEERRRLVGQAREGGTLPPAAQAAALAPLLARRYANTPIACGAVLVAAPVDATGAFGFDLLSGRDVWQNKDLDPATLVGSTGQRAIFCGSADVTAIDPATGQAAWRWAAKGGPVAGPAACRAGRVLVPTAGGVVSLDGASGAAGTDADNAPNLRAFLLKDAVRRALEAAGGGHGGGPP